MTKHLRSVLACAPLAALALALPFADGAAAQGAQWVTLDAACNPKMTGLEERLYLQANESTDALRRFIWTRRGIYQLDVFDTGVWADGVNTARASCLKKRPQARAGSAAAS